MAASSRKQFHYLIHATWWRQPAPATMMARLASWFALALLPAATSLSLLTR